MNSTNGSLHKWYPLQLKIRKGVIIKKNKNDLNDNSFSLEEDVIDILQQQISNNALIILSISEIIAMRRYFYINHS